MRALLLPLFLLAACSEQHDVMQDLPKSSSAGAARDDVPEARIESALARPVTIGEDGSRLDACGALGIVQGVGAGKTLDMRAAPFGEAKVVTTLANGQRLYICTRSIDQRWLGIVAVPPSGDAADAVSNAAAAPHHGDDCGVSSPVESKRPYDGPCASGWVASSFVRAVGN